MKLTHAQVAPLILRLATQIAAWKGNNSVTKVYPIPRGGVPVAYALINHTELELVDSPDQAELFIDDLIDSGNTLEKYCDDFPGIPFFALIDKRYDHDFKGQWIDFPWEVNEELANGEGITENVTRIFQFIGENPKRQGLLETPRRYQKALGEWFSGYNYDDASIKGIFKSFEDGAEDADEMVIRRNIPVYSHCEHHIAPIFGFVTVAYIPNKKVLGLSKMDRIVEVFSRRLQVQERLTNQIANAMWDNLNPIGVGVYLTARHMCIESRGVNNQNSETVTTALRGAMKDKPETRAEFLAACRV